MLDYNSKQEVLKNGINLKFKKNISSSPHLVKSVCVPFNMKHIGESIVV